MQPDQAAIGQSAPLRHSIRRVLLSHCSNSSRVLLCPRLVADLVRERHPMTMIGIEPVICTNSFNNPLSSNHGIILIPFKRTQVQLAGHHDQTQQLLLAVAARRVPSPACCPPVPHLRMRGAYQACAVVELLMKT